jgi:tetratricopeptide (TPR) repeat protein
MRNGSRTSAECCALPTVRVKHGEPGGPFPAGGALFPATSLLHLGGRGSGRGQSETRTSSDMNRNMTLRSACFCALLVVASGETVRAQHGTHDGPGVTTDSVPLYDGLGTLARAITTDVAAAQQYFNQGLRLTYGFGHDEAVRSFREAIRRDPACAMCYWGVAWALGPYLNAGRDSARIAEAFVAIAEARRLASAASDVERALIDAMATRYERVPVMDRQARLDSAYATAMRDLVRRFPHDLDIGTLYGEALMVLRPWDHWTRDGRPQPGTEEVLAVLESVLGRDIRHPGACHLYVHAVEASPAPQRAEPCAEFLGDAIPMASHVPHMPSHIWMRIGRYGDGVRANQRAWHADQMAVHGRGVPIYPTHNLHMLLFAASMDGQSAVAWQAAKDLARISAASGFYESLVLARFGRWDDVLDLSAAPDNSFRRGIWRHARGLAHLRKGSTDSAQVQLDSLDAILRSTPDSLRFRGHRQVDLLGIARGILAGEVQAAAGRHDEAVRTLEAVLPLEDSLEYDEPEPWITPVRHVLGAILLEAGRAPESERVHREALVDHRDNGWSLFGLEQALRAQGRTAEADEVRLRFERAWTRSDVWLASSRF